ncbi:MAG TPA: NADH/ubiquinone/plastoquinone (complex I) [Bacteroidetes bacterium]|nr:NADH/ubiquinone/plastoquinone (complex I) [Bacteroidota bacterium]
MESFIPLFVILPLAAAFLIPIVGKFVSGFQMTLSNLVFLFLAAAGVWFLFDSNTEAVSYTVGGWEPVNGIPIAIYLVADGLSLIMLAIINTMAFLSGFYAISYLKQYTAPDNFYALLCLMVAGMNGVVLTGDLFNLYVFLEIAVIASYALVAFGTGKEELEASFKYQVLGGIASLLILFGVAMVYWKTRTLNIADAATLLKHSHDRTFHLFVQLLFITGFGLKGALIPFHAWLPDAHSSAPSPISAMLSGVLIKAIGIYCMIRIFFNMFILTEEFAVILTTLGALSMVLGALIAMVQNDMKRMFAYSSISQVGYIITGIGMGMIILARKGDQGIAALAIGGGLFHMINHAVFKGLLFLNAGAVEYENRTRNLDELGDLSTVMPVTYGTSLTASLSVSGIPPFNGFFSKLIIIIAAIQGHFYLLAALAVVVSIITLGYFLKFQKQAFFNVSRFFNKLKIKEVPFTMCFSMIVLAILCLVLSLLVFPGPRDLILTPAVEAVMNVKEYSTIITGI